MIPTSVCPHCRKSHPEDEGCLRRSKDLPQDLVKMMSHPASDPRYREMPTWLVFVIALIVCVVAAHLLPLSRSAQQVNAPPDQAAR